MSELDYLELERQSETKHEYVNGRIVAMSGGTSRHSLLAANTIRAVGERLRTGGRNCVPLTSDQRIYVPATGLYTYPDVTVVCGKPEYHTTDPSTLVNPILIVEVLSTSTEAYDRGAKFAHYQSLVSLKGYVLISQAERRIESFLKVEVGWLYTEFRGQAVATLEAIEVTVPLDEIYENAESFAGD